MFHPACFAHVHSWIGLVVAIFMGHENGDKQRPTKRQQMHGLLDKTAGPKPTKAGPESAMFALGVTNQNFARIKPSKTTSATTVVGTYIKFMHYARG